MKLAMFAGLIVMQLQGWDVFKDVKFKTSYNDELETFVDIPKFGDELKALDGNRVKIKGHYLPLELKDEQAIILSKFPYASCFFCGGAGLESVIEVHFAAPQKRFKADEVITVEGTLKLNKDDFEHLVFVLDDAERMVWEDRGQ